MLTTYLLEAWAAVATVVAFYLWTQLNHKKSILYWVVRTLNADNDLRQRMIEGMDKLEDRDNE